MAEKGIDELLQLLKEKLSETKVIYKKDAPPVAREVVVHQVVGREAFLTQMRRDLLPIAGRGDCPLAEIVGCSYHFFSPGCKKCRHAMAFCEAYDLVHPLESFIDSIPDRVNPTEKFDVKIKEIFDKDYVGDGLHSLLKTIATAIKTDAKIADRSPDELLEIGAVCKTAELFEEEFSSFSDELNRQAEQLRVDILTAFDEAKED